MHLHGSANDLFGDLIEFHSCVLSLVRVEGLWIVNSSRVRGGKSSVSSSPAPRGWSFVDSKCFPAVLFSNSSVASVPLCRRSTAPFADARLAFARDCLQTLTTRLVR